MYKYTAILALLLTAGCLHSSHDHKNSNENPEHTTRTEEQKQIQRDMRHNRCVSRGHIVGSARYHHCMKVKY